VSRRSNPPLDEEIAHLHLRQVQVSQLALATTYKRRRCGSYNQKHKKNWTRCYRPPKVRPSGGAFKGEL
ncbi:MAG TPA: hypothetical protein VN843_34250, partial [Anaerolineales bacterium]|nr:hypothetical protein [Anaerolineales bacterium]